MAVSETIQQILQGIDDAQYGRDMRDYIHKGIQKCYEEGSAGETDLEAREDIADIQATLDSFSSWYTLPYGEETAGVFTYDTSLIINPTLKLCEFSFKVTRVNTGSVTKVGNIAYALPVISYKRENDGRTSGIIAYRTERYFPVYASDGTNCVARIYCMASTGTPPVSSSTVIEILGLPAVNAYVCGMIMYPYVKMATGISMDDAVLIDN